MGERRAAMRIWKGESCFAVASSDPLRRAELQAGPILQSGLLDPPWSLSGGSRLPGTGPVASDGWMLVDDAFAPQMELRDRLILGMPDAVHALRPRAFEAARELLGMAIAVLRERPDYCIRKDDVVRPDGTEVSVDFSAPLLTLGRLVQEDFCMLQKTDTEHVMTGAILCFPASWLLAEKMDRPLIGIHEPVRDYGRSVATRVQRLFDGIRPGRPLMRSNCLLYSDAALFQPRSENERRRQSGPAAKYARLERQCLVRLPESDAVAFSIHTTVVEREELVRADREALAGYFAPAGHKNG